MTALRDPARRSKVVAAARTAGTAALALGVFGSIITAAGTASGDVHPVALKQTLAAAAPAALAPANAQPAPAAAVPAPMPEPAPVVVPAPPAPPAPSYPDNLDGWIRQALDIMSAHGIPGSYDGILRNVLRESSGNPQAINLYDSNAAMGIPSKGLLQVIDPTFNAYHVPGTSTDVWDPVANIVAACNYAAARYGSMDNVNSAY
ncbi:transglycosylase SLT domain-containing protein [Nocardia sp. NBC_01503]|uniref:transglycosylase SLT domain-containing protein n=1 Tax=Nocardia sp. NBC_01503 TaxID=2975997 RepID=UPI002E7ABBB5|nr:transglycosylase SLT domain-containing protein [Nocardia sp. NBC_01503]WTL35696.1 transglycosylase SLT domain-containing protein [Nocardia sp. NBC_01503]